MSNYQSGIMQGVPTMARYLTFSMLPGVELGEALERLAEIADGDRVVVGVGVSLVKSLNRVVDGLWHFPVMSGPGLDVPSTPAALWVWLRGDDRGDLLHLSREVESCVQSAFVIEDVVDSFKHGDSLDLTGYEDGTENPEGEAAEKAAFVSGVGSGQDGSSFVAVQQWQHDLDYFESLEEQDQDHIIGRRRSDNEELDDAPVSAHVKRTAQEDFDPEAFILRRSMPWANEMSAGLYFVAFGESFEAYEALLQRMVGMDDGVVDALFSISQPVSGAYFWCPPMKDDKLDLSALGL